MRVRHVIRVGTRLKNGSMVDAQEAGREAEVSGDATVHIKLGSFMLV